MSSAKIAVFKSLTGGTIFLGDWGAEGAERVGYMRLTEFVTVEFPDLPPKEVVGKQLDMLSAKEAEAREQFQRVLNEINDERGKLLALTNQSETQT